MNIKKVRTRFAPSPTGYMHLGGARTALFNYLFAKHHGGEFLVRFEDTDRERNSDKTINEILRDLNWLGVVPDATIGTKDQYAPYLQSKRLSIYQEYVAQLLSLKKAYLCFCSPEELKFERERQIKSGKKAPQYNQKCLQLTSAEIMVNNKKNKSFCIRLHVQSGQKIAFKDLVYGAMEFNSQDIEDFVLIKSDRFPTYHFAVVVDDYLMEITHVLRGSDHLSNTAKQILLYQSFNWVIPVFGHLSLIQFKDQNKMSKWRYQLEQYIDYYREKGYLPISIFNYLALLGWTPDKFEELFTKSELIKRFDGRGLNKSKSVFSQVKLDWISRKQIEKMSKSDFELVVLTFADEIIKFLSPFQDAKTTEIIKKKNDKKVARLKRLLDSIFDKHYKKHNETKKTLSKKQSWDEKLDKKKDLLDKEDECLEWKLEDYKRKYQMSYSVLIKLMIEFLQSSNFLEAAILFRKEINNFSDLLSLIKKHLLSSSLVFSSENTNFLEKYRQLLQFLYDQALNIVWTKENIQKLLLDLQAKTIFKGRDFYAPLYMIANGLKEGPQMKQFLFLLGKEQLLINLKLFLNIK